MYLPIIMLTDQILKPETLELFEGKKREEILHHAGTGKDFLSKTPVTQKMRERFNKWHGIKLKSFYIVKETIDRVKR